MPFKKLNHYVFSKAQVNLLFQAGFGNENSGNLDHHLRKSESPWKNFWINSQLFWKYFSKIKSFFLYPKFFSDEKKGMKRIFEGHNSSKKDFWNFLLKFFSTFFFEIFSFQSQEKKNRKKNFFFIEFQSPKSSKY